MKRLIITITTAIILAACSKDKCEYSPGCEPFGENTAESGITVVTYNADKETEFVGAIYDTRNYASAPIGNDWAPSLISAGKLKNPADWTLGKIGRVFGITIDDNSNIYLASSGVYGQYSWNPLYKNINPGRIYKAVAGSYNISTLVDLPVSYSGLGSLNGIGNIAYDKVNKQIFATNLDNGKIYRISMAGVVLGTFDPWAADTSIPDITTQDEQIWGIGVNYEKGKVKIYFPRITSPATTLTNRNVYSITLNTDGSFPASAVPALEIANLPGVMSAITDIEFSGDSRKIVLAERGDPHNAISFSYNKVGSTWVSNTQYYVGGLTGKNSAGGVDFSTYSDGKNSVIDCDGFIWNSGNYLEPSVIAPGKVYGIMGTQYTGNTLIGSPTKDLFIDYNPPSYTWQGSLGKGDIGDVDVFDSNKCFCITNKK